MLSYIVAFVAFVVFFSNPIYQAIWPSSQRSRGDDDGRLPHHILLNESLVALPDPNFNGSECLEDGYLVRVFSQEPLVLYIENFLSEDERKHLLEISEPLYEPSTITHDGISSERDTSIRSSDVALIPRTLRVQCVESRARALQGWPANLFIERLRVQRYAPGGHYGHHFDWSSSSSSWSRVSSFMAWVHASDDLVGGATEFPLLPVSRMSRESGTRWCRFVECDEEGNVVTGWAEPGRGVRFKVKEGNAVFWVNFDGRGEGVRESWHAGLEVERGRKVGLNIWSFGRV